jgi:hypothetical protein
MQPVRKLEGAPARVIAVHFAPDGASVLALEGRPSKDESPGARVTFAVSRRPIGGGAAKDLFASEEVLVLDIAPLGDGVVTLQRPQLPASEDGNGSSDRWEDLREVINNMALFRAGDGGAPMQISPEGRRCLGVVGSAGGQWLAYSIAPPRPADDRFVPREEEEKKAETHVLGAKPGEEITLSIKGLVRDISPDGSRVLVRRAPPSEPNEIPVRVRARTERAAAPAVPLDTAKSLVMVTVKDQTLTDLPASLKVDGADIDTAELPVAFSGDGLVFRSAKGDLYGSALDGSKAARLAGALEDAAELADAGTPANGAGGANAAASPDAGTLPDGGAPPAKRRRVFGPKGTLFELREEEGVVLLSSAGAGTPGAAAPVAQFEGPLSSIGEVAFDASEKRIALAVLSDTSRDGSFDKVHDDAELFVTDDASSARSFGRGPVALLADELRPKIASAAGLAESAVVTVPEGGSIKATLELPWIAGEKAAALFDRALVTARAVVAVVPQIRKSRSTCAWSR